MRIVMVSQHYAPELTGNAPYVASLASELALRGYDVEVVTAYPFYPHWRVPADYDQRTDPADRSDVRVRRYRPVLPRRLSHLTRMFAEVVGGVRAFRELSRTRPDAVIYVSPALLQISVVKLLSSFRRHIRAVPRLVWVQDLYSIGFAETGGRGRLIARVLSGIERRTIASNDVAVVIHDRFRDALVARIGVPADQIVVIRNWTHIDIGGAVPRSRAELGWPEGERIVLHAGNQGVKQGLENVIDAARLVEEAGLPIRFVLLGNGNQREVLESRALGCTAVDFMESVADEDFGSVLTAADVLLVNEKPGLVEMSVPSKLTSYFVTGRPVVAASDASSVTLDAETADAVGGSAREYQLRKLGKAEAVRSFDELIRSTIASGQRR